MPLFTEAGLLSEEAAVLFRAQDLLAASSALQQLLEAADTATAEALIVMGPHDPPLDPKHECYTIDELENRIAFGQLFPFDDERGLAVFRSRAVGAISEKAGVLKLHVRRQVRDAEYNAAYGRRDVWLYFLDRTSRMMEQFIEAADLNLASAQIVRLGFPKFNHREDWPAQGKFVYADFAIAWGGSEQAE